MYRMDAELLDRRGNVLDAQSESFGIRTVQILDRHLVLNGERVRLTGLTRHEDSPWEGLAETRGTMRRDFDDLKALHTTLTRPVHYPQNPYILDYADRHGILLIPEIPVWQFSEAQLSNAKVQALARQQMQEMIEQAGNHPSIFAWSVANESATGTPGGIEYFRMMRDFIRSIDPGRYVSYADDNLPKLERAEQSAANDADFLMMNQYFGTWHGPAAALLPALDRVNQLFPKKMVIISEWGYPGFFAKDPREADPERIRTLQEQMPLMAARDWIAGTIQWCYQDYKSRRNLWPGQAEGYVEHGVVDEARQRKPSYEVWKEMTAPAKLETHWVRDANAVTGFVGTVTPNSPADIPYFPLHDYEVAWSLLDEKGKRCRKRKSEVCVLEPGRAGRRANSVRSRRAFAAPHLDAAGPNGCDRRGAGARMAGATLNAASRYWLAGASAAVMLLSLIGLYMRPTKPATDTKCNYFGRAARQGRRPVSVPRNFVLPSAANTSFRTFTCRRSRSICRRKASIQAPQSS